MELDECPEHGKPTKRAECRECNAAYMRSYLRNRRRLHPEKSLLKRAKQRADDLGVAFNLEIGDIFVPKFCPALGIPIIPGGRRSYNSPSLDRVLPQKGYVKGNVRVISDRANRLKSHFTLAQIRMFVAGRDGEESRDYRLVEAYMEREAALNAIRNEASRTMADKCTVDAAAILEDLFGKEVLHVDPTQLGW